jgi:hypothetical protein
VLMPSKVPLSALSCDALGVASVRVNRVQVPDAEPSTVTFAPPELHPFAVRFDFRYVEDDEGVRGNWCVGHALEEPAARQEPVRVEPRHTRTLEENVVRYRRIAESLIEMDWPEAVERRGAMLATEHREKRAPLTDLHLADIEAEHRNRGGTPVVELAIRRGIDRSTYYRQLQAAKRRRRS